MVKEKAYAKINLFLNVIDKRKDGYHDLEMIMAPLKLHDVLTFKVRKDQQIVLESDVFITEKIEDNLIYKVAKYMKTEFNIEKGVTIHLKKRIPLAGGLAGGSADAAATIKGLNRLWKLQLREEDMAEIGVGFGADIPFCVYNKTALVKGIGEKLEFIRNHLNCHVLLVKPNVDVSTKDVFSNVKEKDIVIKHYGKMIEGLKNGDLKLVSRELFNYLERYTFNLKPIVRALKNNIKNKGIDGVLMSGSGSTVFALCDNKKVLKDIMKNLDPSYFSNVTAFL